MVLRVKLLLSDRVSSLTPTSPAAADSREWSTLFSEDSKSLRAVKPAAPVVMVEYETVRLLMLVASRPSPSSL